MQQNLAVVEGYNKLLLELIARSKEDILVTAIEDSEILYSTRSNVQAQEIYGIIRDRLERKHRRMGDRVPEWVW